LTTKESSVLIKLCGHAIVDALAKAATRRIGGKLFLIHLEESLVILSDTLDGVNVAYRCVRAIRRNFSGGVGEHARELLVFALFRRVRETKITEPQIRVTK
jgi:hypothetical protein